MTLAKTGAIGKSKALTSAVAYGKAAVSLGALGKSKALTSAAAASKHPVLTGALSKSKALVASIVSHIYILFPAGLSASKALTSVAVRSQTRTATGAIGKSKALTSAAAHSLVGTATGALGKSKSVTSTATARAVRNAGTGADDATIGSVAWANPGNATGPPDGSGATATLTIGTSPSHYLVLTNFGFQIPAGATIDGIILARTRRNTVGTGNCVDNVVKLWGGGAVVGTDHSTGTAWPATYTNQNVGSSVDTWGAAPTPASINVSGFGVAISAKETSGTGSIADVDSVQLTIYYH